MAKEKRGLPKSFSLDIDEQVLTPAADMGDFLDETLPEKPKKKPIATDQLRQLRKPIRPLVGKQESAEQQSAETQGVPATGGEPEEVQVSDHDEEELAQPPQRLSKRPRTSEAKVWREEQAAQQELFEAKNSEVADSTSSGFAPKKKKSKIVQREFSLDAETCRMLDHLLHDIQTQTPERGATVSELVRALITGVYESRRFANYENVNRRGQWGSAMARAFQTDLKEVFVRAIGDLRDRNYDR